MIHRIDVVAADSAFDPTAKALSAQLVALGHEVGQVQSRRVFFLDTDANAPDITRLCGELLADPIVERAVHVTESPHVNGSWLEVHLKPGVMDPVAASTEMAIRDFGLDIRQVRTGRAFAFESKLSAEVLREIASRALANEVIESIHTEAVLAEQFPRGAEYQLKLRHVSLRNLDDDALKKLSRDGHLFLSLDEMKAVQDYYRQVEREPTDVELETIAQTWSEHCVHKTLKSAVEVYDESGKLLRRYKNLIKETIFKATAELMQSDEATKRPSDAGSTSSLRGSVASSLFCLSVFKDNAGVIAFDETDAVCFKVETHNHPSAIEPYGGAATGAGGVIRDILGTGLAAKPVANTDVFCVAFPERGDGLKSDEATKRRSDEGNAPTSSLGHSVASSLPRGVIHPKRVLQQVVAGVRDYGNRMGIPTINGAVYFDERYIGNPLVFCGCVGIIPRNKIEKQTQRGDTIVVLGGRTGRDGIHGATFSSAELTDTHADEFSHAVQIGNAITEKKVADVVLQARDRGLFTAITDCGAGGLSSAVGEMGADVGAQVQLEKVPLKYAGLRYDEIWISEAQERMVMSVPASHIDELLKLAASEDVEATVIGTFGTERDELVLRYGETEVGRLAMKFLHDGIPMPTRRAVVKSDEATKRRSDEGKTADQSSTSSLRRSVASSLLSFLSHPNIASKHWIIRQYDHEVQAGSVVKPLIGPMQIGPSDASVIRPKLNTFKGVVVSCGLAPHVSDPYEMSLAAIDEAIRNAVCVGANLDKLAMLDNFCWPSVDDELTMGTLVRSCEACYAAAKAYGVPFISGKDSLHNQFTDTETGKVIRIPNTLLISTIGVIDDVRKCVTMDFKAAGSSIWLVRSKSKDLPALAKLHRTVSTAIGRGLVRSCHDVSEGGALTSVAEMCIASGLGAALVDQHPREADWWFEERVGEYVIELSKANFASARQAIEVDGVEMIALGEVVAEARLALVSKDETRLDLGIDQLTEAWRGTLDW